MAFNLRVHAHGNEKLVAICDKDVNGKRLTHNGVKLTIRKEFYGKEIFSAAEVLTELTNCTSINAFGKKICELLIEHNIAHPAAIIWMSDENDKIGHTIVIR